MKARRILVARRLSGLSVDQAARLLDIKASRLSQLEHSVCIIPVDETLLNAMANVYGTSLVYLLGHQDEPWRDRERCKRDGLTILVIEMDAEEGQTPCDDCRHSRKSCGGLPRKLPGLQSPEDKDR